MPNISETMLMENSCDALLGWIAQRTAHASMSNIPIPQATGDPILEPRPRIRILKLINRDTIDGHLLSAAVDHTHPDGFSLVLTILPEANTQPIALAWLLDGAYRYSITAQEVLRLWEANRPDQGIELSFIVW